MVISEERILYILKNKKIDECSEDEKKQVFYYAFGGEFMESNDKGVKKQYIEVFSNNK